MDEIKMIIHNDFSGIDDIKAASLYFDHIEVTNHYRPYLLKIPGEKPKKHKDGKKYVNGRLHLQDYFSIPSFKEHLKPLLDENLVELKYEIYKNEQTYDEKYFVPGDPELNLGPVLFDNQDKFFRTLKYPIGAGHEDNVGELKPEAEEVIKSLNLTKYVESGAREQHSLLLYYGHLLSATLRNIDSGNNVLTTSEILNGFLTAYYNGKEFKQAKSKIQEELGLNPFIAFEAINLALPNLSRLPVDEILEIRRRLKDQLFAFKELTKSIQLEFESSDLDENYLRVKSKELVKVKIKPALDDLIAKFSDTNLTVANSLLKELKDIKSYSPLLLTLSSNISNTYAILVSLGGISLSTAIDYFKSKKEMRRSGMYYLFKLRTYNN